MTMIIQIKDILRKCMVVWQNPPVGALLLLKSIL